MPKIEQIQLSKGTALGVRVDLPKAPLVMIRASKGFAMCGYLNMESVNKTGEVAVRVTGVKTFDDVLNAPIKAATTKAKQLGLEPGKVVKDVIIALG